jgi:hypothetical protein
VSHATRSAGLTLAQTLGRFVAECPTAALPALALERAKMSLASTF